MIIKVGRGLEPLGPVGVYAYGLMPPNANPAVWILILVVV